MRDPLALLFVSDSSQSVSGLREHLRMAAPGSELTAVGSLDDARAFLTLKPCDFVLAADPEALADAVTAIKETGRGIPLLLIRQHGEAFDVVRSLSVGYGGPAAGNLPRPLEEVLLAAGHADSTAAAPSIPPEMARQILLEITETGTATPELGEFLEKIHLLLQSVFKTPSCSFLIRDALSGQADFAYWSDEFRDRPESTGRVRGLADHVLLTGEPFAAGSADCAGIFDPPAKGGRTPDWTSWVGVPLRVSYRTYGVLALHSYGGAPPLGEEDIQLLSRIGDQVALAIDRKRADRALRESEARYRRLFDYAPDGIMISDPAAKILDVNESLCRILKYSREDLLRVPGSELVEPEEIPEIERSLEDIASRSEHHREWRLRRSDGVTIPADVSSTLMSDGNILAIVRDVSERREAEAETARLTEEVERQRERLNNIVTHVPGIVWETAFPSASDAPIVNFVSDYVFELLGYTPEEWLSTPHFRIQAIREDWRDKVVETALSIRPGERRVQEIPLITKSGKEVWVEAHSAAICGPDGEVIGTRGVMIDITERKQSEHLLLRSEERYRDLVENAHDIIYAHDLKGNYTSINAAATHITGYTRNEILQMNMAETIAPEFLERSKEMMAAKLAGKDVTAYELEVIAKDGRRVSLEVNTRLIYDRGEPVAVQGIARDITERKQFEERYRQSQKMEAIGLLAGGISHDFNNLLTAINGFSEITLAKMDKSDPLRQNLVEIKQTGERAADLTQQLLAFSRKQVLRPVVHNLNSVIDSMDKMLRRVVRENIEFDINLEPKLANIMADPRQLEQVIVNLAVNAQDSMPKGGVLTIRTENVTAAQAEKAVGKLGGGRPFVRMTVADVGEGIDKKTLPRIFEPFFTTKELGKGTGLGLPTVHGIVKQSGGEIMVSSAKGKGTKFFIYLPAVEPTAEQEVWQPERRKNLKGSETVLLVEDDTAVRKLVREILSDNGYHVLEAPSGEAALKICNERSEPIHLLLTDLVMPKMSGIELTGRVLRVHPEAKPIVMSGYTGTSSLSDLIPNFEATFLEKPFTPEGLMRTVRDVIAPRAGAKKGARSRN